jgi:hypothetical protein
MGQEAFGYQWVRKSTGEFYRGVHKGSPDDWYAGSGKIFVDKYGGRNKAACKNPDDWVRNVLFMGTYDECLLWESLVVTERVLEDPSCLNLVVGGSKGCEGMTVSKETRAKMSKAHTGRKHTEETLALLSKINSGTNHPSYGKKHSEETKQKIGKASAGRRHTEETRAKMSEQQKGKPKSEETKQKISIANTGRTQSEESKKKKSDKMKAYWAKRKETTMEGEVDVKQH